MAEPGDTDWDDIVERHAERVYRVSLRILGIVEDAEDVAQEVFAEAFRTAAASPVESWTGLLVRLAALRSIDRLRRRRPAQALRDTDKVSLAEPIEDVLATELAEMLRQAIAQLPDQQAAVFAMTHFEELSREEVSASLRISPEGVSTALYKARRRLVQRLAVYTSNGESR